MRAMDDKQHQVTHAEVDGSAGGCDADELCEAIPSQATRRGFLAGSAKKLGYAAPIVLLFRPKQACASGGSEIAS